MSNAAFWTWFVSAVLVSLFGDVAMKQAGQGATDYRWLTAGLTAYMSTSFAWFFLLRVRKLSTFGTLYPVANAIGLVALGAIIFGERLGLREWVGVGLGLAAMAVLSGGH